MNQDELNKLLEICKKKIDNGKDALNFLESNFSEEVFLELENNLNNYIDEKENRNKKNKKYWMLICNPLDWGEGEEPYLVNELLYNLDEVSWTINKHTDITHKMKEGHRGIIKVSKDNRTKEERCDEKGVVVEKLTSGIYAIFEVIQDEDGDCTYETKNDEWFVNIKVIDNLYRKNKIISKEKSIEFLTENIFFSRPSREISKVSYEKIIEYNKS